MLIRSQNKKEIVNLNNIRRIKIFLNRGKKFEIYYTVNEEIEPTIGEYSTEEKAINVLDMIQDAYLSKTRVSCNADGYGVAYNQTVVFQMPQDEEVKID